MWNWIFEDVGCFKVSPFLSLFNAIKTAPLSVSPTVAKDGRWGVRGTKERIIGANEGKCGGERGESSCRNWVKEWRRCAAGKKRTFKLLLISYFSVFLVETELCVSITHPPPAQNHSSPTTERKRGAPVHTTTTTPHSPGRGVNFSKTSSVQTHTHTLQKMIGRRKRWSGGERGEGARRGEGLRKGGGRTDGGTRSKLYQMSNHQEE